VFARIKREIFILCKNKIHFFGELRIGFHYPCFHHRKTKFDLCGRVARFGEVSPNVSLFTWGQLFKNYSSSPHFWATSFHGSDQKMHVFALAAWRSGHRIILRDSRPGFEARQCIRFLGKT
jgi:hypothetical protein